MKQREILVKMTEQLGKINSAKKARDDSRLKVLAPEYKEMEEHYNLLTLASTGSGTQTGRALQARKMDLHIQYDERAMVNRSVISKGGKSLTHKERAKIEDTAGDLEANHRQIKRTTKESTAMANERAMKDHRRRQRAVKPIKETRKERAERTYAEARRRFKELTKQGC